MQFEISSYDEVSSTNDLIIEAIDRGNAEGVVVCASSQKGGQGRQGRSWQSPLGGLYFSVLLRPTRQDPASLTLAIGLAIQQFLHKIAPSVWLKWPNDIVVVHDQSGIDSPRFGKLCGMLAKGHHNAICLGVGLNVHRPTLPLDTSATTPVYLEDLVEPCPSISEMQNILLKEIDRAYILWNQKGFAPLREIYDEANILMGRTIALQDTHGTILARGSVVGTDPEGCLILVDNTGAKRCVRSGEAHILW